MARFYEQHGFAILWTLTSALGIALVYWSLVALAMYAGVLPTWADSFVLATHDIVTSVGLKLINFIEKRVQWFGAFATLATFVFGLVTGIRQAKRQLPQRLAEFMTQKLAPVYDNSEAIVAAVSYRSASVVHRAQLFRKDPLNQALNALGDPFRHRLLRHLFVLGAGEGSGNDVLDVGARLLEHRLGHFRRRAGIIGRLRIVFDAELRLLGRIVARYLANQPQRHVDAGRHAGRRHNLPLR
jgi:hypothetical protein